jgi:hypothetical protein
MGKKSRQKKKKAEHPTVFVFDGAIRHHEEGSMFHLHTQVTTEEWQQIVRETIEYKIFAECLKDVAFPILKETWTKIEDWWRLQLGIAVTRMKEIDPMIFLGINQDKIRAQYTQKIQANAQAVVEDIKNIRETMRIVQDNSKADVSEL